MTKKTNNQNTEKQVIHNPHDKTLFNALKNHDVARDAMRAYLPKELLLQANLEAIIFEIPFMLSSMLYSFKKLNDWKTAYPIKKGKLICRLFLAPCNPYAKPFCF